MVEYGQTHTKIRLLDAQTANQIAAGEVVERPVSVIKELVENAIDAHASRITIKVSGEELECLQVTDNGCGMSPEDMVQALKRHATSKLRRIEDLDSLTTMGFRGEALPSIASVSEMTITSHADGAECGYTLKVKNGIAAVPEATGAPVGTTIIVDRLFANTPARRKFLKTSTWEMGLISDFVGRMAIALPQIAFILQHDQRTLLRTSGSGEMDQAVLAVYGKEVLSQLVGVEWQQGFIVHGLVSLPQISRASRQHYTFFVNGRWVKSRELTKAVDEAYHTILPQKRYPIVLLYLELAPAQIDVNVHPAKLEIKFKNAEAVKNGVRDAIAQALRKKEQAQPHLGRLHAALKPTGERKVSQPPAPAASAEQTRLRELLTAKPAPPSAARLGCQESAASGSLEQVLAAPPPAGQLGCQEAAPGRSLALPPSARAAEPVLTPALYALQQAQELYQEPAPAPQAEPFLFASLRPLGQVDGTYILCTDSDNLYFIDQHAAHERIRYEQLVQELHQGQRAVNQLAVPQTVELTHQETLWLVDQIITLTDMGFILEHFGDNTFVIRGVPSWYEGTDGEFLLRQVVEAGRGSEQLREEEIFLRACKSAVKANRYLTPADISNLLSELDKCANPNTCPHGRPVIVKISMAEIRRTFLRTNI